MFPLELIVYDDACHLKKYSVNPKEKILTSVAEGLSGMDMVVDNMNYTETTLTVGARQTAIPLIARTWMGLVINYNGNNLYLVSTLYFSQNR